jgi:tetratricopeptide (TPR) repeat protein
MKTIFTLVLAGLLFVGCTKDKTAVTSAPSGANTATTAPGKWGQAKERIMALNRLSQSKDTDVDKKFFEMVDFAVSSGEDDIKIYNKLSRISENEAFQASQYNDDLIYDLIVNSAGQGYPSAPDLISKYPASIHRLAVNLLTGKISTSNNIAYFLNAIKDLDANLKVHGPYNQATDFRALNIKAVTVENYRMAIDPLPGFTQDETFISLMDGALKARNEAWLWEAVKIYEHNKKNSELTGLYQTLGELRAERGSYKEAVDFFTKSIKADTTNVAAKKALASAQFELGMMNQKNPTPEVVKQAKQEAVSFEKKNVGTDNVMAKQHNFKGMDFYRQKQYEKAIEEFKKAIEMDSTYGTAHFNLACVYALKNDQFNSLKYLRLTLDLNPSFYLPKAESDSDLSRIRASNEFQSLLADSRSKL